MKLWPLSLVVFALGPATWPAAAAADGPQASCSPKACSIWQPGPVTVSWKDTNPNPASDPAACDQTIAGETLVADLPLGTPVTCDDGDPNGPVTYHVKIDKTPPAVGVTPAPNGAHGWYTTPVDLTLSGTDALSGIASCAAPIHYAGPSGSHIAVGGCTDEAGNSTQAFIDYDDTPPATTAVTSRPPDGGVWFNHPVDVVFGGVDSASGIEACDPAVTVSSNTPAGGRTVTGSCTNGAGLSQPASTTVFYDATPPDVALTVGRLPDFDGWYNHPVSFTAVGSDAASGLAACGGGSYSGPDSAHASVTGACSDVAGNTAGATRSFQYDATPPARAVVAVTPGNRRVDLSWTLPPDARSVVVVRSEQGAASAPRLVYSGRAGSVVDRGLRNRAKYRYTVTDIDQAGNSSAQTVPAVPTASSLRPFVGSAVSGPPLLTWKPVKRARYYNVQLYRGGKKVLSKWPRRASVQVAGRWHYRGHTYNFLPGHYRWYVWPGLGPKRAHRYGKLLGSSSFRAR